MIEAVIFDMDGTLIDSEPMWKAAEQSVFSSVGVEVTEELSAITAAMTTREVTEFWFNQSPWQHKTLAQVEAEVIERVEILIARHGMPMAGVEAILAFFHARNIKIGLATNSPYQLIAVALERLGIAHYFDAISSSEHEQVGKPEPDVYLTTLNKLGADAARCLAFEDSVSGLRAARLARIKTVAIPPVNQFADTKFAISTLKLRSLADFNDSHLKSLQTDIGEL